MSALLNTSHFRNDAIAHSLDADLFAFRPDFKVYKAKFKLK
jgi:hypothetical protein